MKSKRAKSACPVHDAGIPYALTQDPIEIGGPSPSENSVIREATAIQSSVTPEQYPKADRDLQVAAATGKSGKSFDQR